MIGGPQRVNTATLSKSGTLVHARGRERVVLPESTDELLMLRPVGGFDEEVTGILPAIEPVESATFRLPGREDLGDFTSGRLLREAARLCTRAAAGPFRSFGRIAVEPRPYQLVPLMMALKLDPVRLLIADDVGIGKTIEACLIARELLDRGEIRRTAVLCPPHLAEQWQRELAEKFHIEAELVLSSTIRRLERDLPLGVSVFDRYRHTVVSTDFIKTPRRAEDFVLKCPEFVIVDEAHGCTLTSGVGWGRQQRHELLRRVTADPNRHVLLVTATPHSGNEAAFRSLLHLLQDDFANLPEDLDRREREGVRRRLARHLIQRRRADIRHYLETDTAFPERRDKEAKYRFSPAYRKLFDDIFSFAREYATDTDGGQRRRRVRYWSSLALLRCVSSSPAAAAATLRSRAAVDEAEGEDVDEVGRRTVLDQGDDDDTVALDFSPGANTEGGGEATRRRMLEFARRAEAMAPAGDRKLQGLVREVRSFLKDGFHPVVFCRFVDTAEYVARHLRSALAVKTRVESVTGRLPPAEREERIASLVAGGGQFVLVCTDCLSEGINLQEHFDAVLHNTRTCPIFRTGGDAELAKAIYRRVPVLIREARDDQPEDNPWGIRLNRMFDMSNDSDRFHTRERLEADGWKLAGNVFRKDGEEFLPLYEAKMIHQFDHRWASSRVKGGKTASAGVPLLDKLEPTFPVLPRYWVEAREVHKRIQVNSIAGRIPHPGRTADLPEPLETPSSLQPGHDFRDGDSGGTPGLRRRTPSRTPRIRRVRAG